MIDLTDEGDEGVGTMINPAAPQGCIDLILEDVLNDEVGCVVCKNTRVGILALATPTLSSFAATPRGGLWRAVVAVQLKEEST